MSAPPSPLPFTLGQLAIAAHDEWLGNLRVIKTLEVEEYRAPGDDDWTLRVKDSIAFSRSQAESMRVLWIALKAMSRHEADFMPLIAVALAAEGLPINHHQPEDAAHERA
jgi:hypothetical protein